MKIDKKKPNTEENKKKDNRKVEQEYETIAFEEKTTCKKHTNQEQQKFPKIKHRLQEWLKDQNR